MRWPPVSPTSRCSASGPFPIAFVALVAVPALGWWPIARSRLGHRLLAVGGDERAAYESGLDVARTKVIAFVLCGLFASIGGLFLTMQAASGDPRIGDTFTLNSIAAVALGGALLSGGRGSVAASVAGALVLGDAARACCSSPACPPTGSTSWPEVSSWRRSRCRASPGAG